MKWAYTIKNKILASVVLLSLCLLVLFSNYLDRVHTESVKNSITTLYEDRLIAEDYILKMTTNIYQIREVLNTDSPTSNTEIIDSLVGDFEGTYTAYMQTKLTPTEKRVANELNELMKDFEHNRLNNIEGRTQFSDKALHYLKQLADVQLDESKLIMEKAEAEYASIKASSQFAFAIVLIILVVLQAMVISSKSLMNKAKVSDTRLN